MSLYYTFLHFSIAKIVKLYHTCYFFHKVILCLPIASLGSIVSSILSLPTCSNHILNGSALGEGID